MTDFLYTDARWTEHFVEVSDPHKEGHHVRFYFERTWVGLDLEEQSAMWDRAEKRQAYQGVPALAALIQEVEAKLKEKNT